MLQKCRLGIPFSQKEKDRLLKRSGDVENAIQLLCTRNEVAKINDVALARLKTPSHSFKALDDIKWVGNRPDSNFDNFSKRTNDGTLVFFEGKGLETQTVMRKGMRVVLQVNLDMKTGLVNGSQGVIIGFGPYNTSVLPVAKTKRTEHLKRWQLLVGEDADLREKQIRAFTEEHQKNPRMGSGFPRVRFNNGRVWTIYPTCRTSTFGEQKPYHVIHRTMIPLMAGWAVSVHFSQGMTLDNVIVDVSKAFAEGQVYVALSRATGLKGLRVDGGERGLEKAVANSDVLDFLREQFGDELFDSVRSSSDEDIETDQDTDDEESTGESEEEESDGSCESDEKDEFYWQQKYGDGPGEDGSDGEECDEEGCGVQRRDGRTC